MEPGPEISAAPSREATPPAFRALWIAVNALLVIAILATVYASFWEYSTETYLAGFSDAVVPSDAAPEARIEAILKWMGSGPARYPGEPSELMSNRDPVETLNYKSLLQVCGTATNAFINLADASDLLARRLLLLDSRGSAKHVVAEVRLGRRWIVVDPGFRAILRGPDGQPLTRRQLHNSTVLTAATRNLRGYDSSYTYERTVHVRLARLSAAGSLLRSALGRIWPNWEDSPALSLLMERKSLVLLFLSIFLTLALFSIQIALRMYAVRRLSFRPVRFRLRLAQGWRAFVAPRG
ncbi:MAG TPA: hypothetical protein VN661_04845 [Candidatus Acidoferrales bacterium]|nr:hypothetical protein [Candidatus Acidoferrales bacterium]